MAARTPILPVRATGCEPGGGTGCLGTKSPAPYLEYGERRPLIVRDDGRPSVRGVERGRLDASAEPVHRTENRVDVLHSEVDEEVRRHLGREDAGDRGAAEVGRGVGAEQGFVEQGAVETVDGFRVPRVQLGPAEGARRVPLAETGVGARLPQAEDP